MRKKTKRFIKRHAAVIGDHLRWQANRHKHPSLHFYTIHKAASSLFGDKILGSIQGRRHVDYETAIYEGTSTGSFPFKRTGYVYGPIRVVTDEDSYENLYREPDESYRAEDAAFFQQTARFQSTVNDLSFVKDRRVVCLIRDPRDVLVSSYFSFGFSHGLSPVPAWAKAQRRLRAWAQSVDVDQYCLGRASDTEKIFQRIGKIADAGSEVTLLRYEDMIDRWDDFSIGLSSSLELTAAQLDELFQQSRPRQSENPADHHRSGRPGGFHEKLKPSTIHELNEVLGEMLDRFGYPR